MSYNQYDKSFTASFAANGVTSDGSEFTMATRGGDSLAVERASKI